jgi:hypothetical protein
MLITIIIIIMIIITEHQGPPAFDGAEAECEGVVDDPARRQLRGKGHLR